MKTRIFYRVITPSTFANFDTDTIEEAREKKAAFGSCEHEEHKEYWKKQGEACKIIKVTETIEEIE